MQQTTTGKKSARSGRRIITWLTLGVHLAIAAYIYTAIQPKTTQQHPVTLKAEFSTHRQK